MRFAGKSKPGYFGSLFVTSLSVNIFIFPVLMYLFGSAGIFAVIINMAAIPVFYALLFILIISSLLAILWPPLGSLLLKPSAVPLFMLDKISGLWKISGYSVLRIDDFSMIYVVLYYTVLVFRPCVFGYLKKPKRNKCSRGVMFSFACTHRIFSEGINMPAVKEISMTAQISELNPGIFI